MKPANNRPLVAAFFNNTNDAENAILELRDRGFTSSQIGTSLESENEMGLFSEAGAGPAEILHRQGKSQDHRSFWQKMKDFFSAESDDYGTRAHQRTQVTDNEFGAISTQGYNIPERFHSRLSSGTFVTVESSRVAEAEEILTHNHGELDREFASSVTERIPPKTEGAPPSSGNDALRRIQLLSVMLRVDEPGSTDKDVNRKDRKVA